MKSSIASLACLALCAAALLVPAGPARAADVSDVKLVHIELYHAKTDELLFRGERQTRRDEGRVKVDTTYTLPDGTRVQRTESVYDNETLKLISHLMVDQRTGEREEIQVDGDTVRVRYREREGAEEEVETLKWDGKTAASAVLVPMMARNADKLASGEPLAFDLIVPSRLETIGFRLKKEAERQMEGKPVTVIRMEPQSWLIRKLVDPMYFYVTRETPHRLLEYQGRASLKTPDGSDLDLRYVYRYPAQG